MIKRAEAHMFKKLKELSVCCVCVCVWESASLSRDLSSVWIRGNRWPDWEVTRVTARVM